MYIRLKVKMKLDLLNKLFSPVCPVCGCFCRITRSGKICVHDPDGYGNCIGGGKVIYYDA